MLRLVLFASLLIFGAISFSIPGVPIQNYENGNKIKVFANELDSIKTQLNFKYYFLKFCEPSNHDTSLTNENLGSKLLGESTQITPYNVRMNTTEHCQKLCTMKFDAEDVKNFAWMIEREYYANLVIDNLPAIYKSSTGSSHVGYPLGYKNSKKTNKDKDEYFIHNHLTFKIEYYPQGNSSRIVGLTIEPKSLGRLPPEVPTKATDASKKQDTKDTTLPPSESRDIAEDGSEGYCFRHDKVSGKPDPQKLTTGYISFSYDVEFIESNKAFGSRWDTYKLLGNENIHWWSILNSFIINFILTAVIGYIMKRTVGNDIRQYNELRTSEDIQEDRGWKQLSRDVFRPPSKALLLSALIGTGVQVGSMFFLTLVFCCLGFVEHSYRGSLLTTVLLFYTFMGMFAGYYSARIYKMFNGLHWIKCTLVTATLYPLINFIIFCGINILLVFEESSSALDPSTTFALIALWFGISIPLVFLGSLIGYKKQAVQNPSKYNPIPKFIKPQPMYLNANVLCLLGGLLPFGSVFIELVFIMMSIWRHSFYYLFAFLFAVLLILVITSAEISIVITYLQLCNGNHRVWWKSFFNTGSIGLYIFCYSIFYYYTELEMIRFSSIILYFGYMFAVSFTFFVFCGTIGFLSSYWFIRTIYASIRID